MFALPRLVHIYRQRHNLLVHVTPYKDLHCYKDLLLLVIPYLLSFQLFQYVYGSVYCALYVRMCEWFFECTRRELVGFCGVGWPVRWRHLSEGSNQHCGNEPISALGIEPISD